jgi:hypothetical protein
MGATPTSKNLELIRKYAPIDSNALKVSARKTGHSKDEVEVTTPDVVYDYKVQHMGCRAKPHEMVTMGIMQGRMEKDASTNVDNCFTVRHLTFALLWAMGLGQHWHVRFGSAVRSVVVRSFQPSLSVALDQPAESEGVVG